MVPPNGAIKNRLAIYVLLMVTVSMMVSDAAVSGVRASNLYRISSKGAKILRVLDERECFDALMT
jgi:hypothetical protein